MAIPYDAIIIGTGQAGPSLAERLSNARMKVAIIERERFGGTCVNTGCTPTKTMVASAYVAHSARHASEFGIDIKGAINVDMKRVKARKDAIVNNSTTKIESWLRGLANCTVYVGAARFEGPQTVRVGDTLLSAEKIFINVGARARVPEMPGVDKVPFLTNSTMLELDFAPEHLVIIGGSYIGLEFGQMFRRFGSRVTIIEMMSRLISREDENISEIIQDIFRREGIELRLNARCITLGTKDNQIVAKVECTEGEPEVEGSHLLLAVGREPNTADLGLDKAGVQVDKHGYILVDDELKTNVPGIWALGDCNGKGAFTHTSYNDFEIVAANLLDKEHRKVSDRIPAYGLFIDPPLGRVGMTEAQVRKSGRPALVGRRPMSRVMRAVEKGETAGVMQVVIDKETKQILGAAVLGVGGDEVIHCIMDTMYAKASYTVLQRAMHIHPTVSELVPTMLEELELL
jgi:pyruvate/2-oxoglutarate dehydrogenase complex dihydrolipoamide dehydrogenase (E3) component